MRALRSFGDGGTVSRADASQHKVHMDADMDAGVTRERQWDAGNNT
jgi:hypothetical protein